MARKDDKWVMFRNFMFNELGITKEDIRKWIDEAVKEQACLMVSEAFERRKPEDMIKDAVYDNSWFGEKGFNRSVTDKAAQILTDRLEIKVKEDKHEHN